MQKSRANCRSYVNVYLKRGKIRKQPCAHCGEPNSKMHHPDYSQPLKVIWLCASHLRAYLKTPAKPPKPIGAFNYPMPL